MQFFFLGLINIFGIDNNFLSGIILFSRMEGVTLKSEIYYHDKLRLHYLEIPSDILVRLNDGNEKGKFNQRVLIYMNESVNWQAGIVALGEGKGYITISKERMKMLGVHLGDTLKFSLSKDNSEYGHEFPLELQEVLKQDSEAKYRWEKLSPGKQRTIIYYILQVKNSDKRIERSLLFMKNLKLSIPGKETMRQLFGKE